MITRHKAVYDRLKSDESFRRHLSALVKAAVQHQSRIYDLEDIYGVLRQAAIDDGLRGLEFDALVDQTQRNTSQW